MGPLQLFKQFQSPTSGNESTFLKLQVLSSLERNKASGSEPHPWLATRAEAGCSRVPTALRSLSLGPRAAAIYYPASTDLFSVAGLWAQPTVWVPDRTTGGGASSSTAPELGGRQAQGRGVLQPPIRIQGTLTFLRARFHSPALQM